MGVIGRWSGPVLVQAAAAAIARENTGGTDLAMQGDAGWKVNDPKAFSTESLPRT